MCVCVCVCVCVRACARARQHMHNARCNVFDGLLKYIQISSLVSLSVPSDCEEQRSPTSGRLGSVVEIRE